MRKDSRVLRAVEATRAPAGAVVSGVGLHPVLIALFAVASGLAAANLYYAQPLIGLIAPELRLHVGLAGLIVALTQVGYGVGLLFLVPLSDRLENRRLVVTTLGAVVLGLLGIALSDSMLTFLAASFLVGVGAVATQILVPFASHLAPPESRGRVVGIVMSGLVGGIMLARPFSSLVASELGWRAIFYISAGLMLVLGIVLLRALPERRPVAPLSYARIMRSLPGLFAHTPILRRRAFYQGMLFAAFNIFWTGSPLLLAREFGLGQRGIAVFALAGAAGALAAPIAGRLADRGLTRIATGFALVGALLAFVISGYAAHSHSLALLVAGAILLDAAVQINQVLSLRSLFMLAPELRGRLNGLFMTFIFAFGAAGSVLASALYVFYGWAAAALAGSVCAVAALALYSTEFRGEKHTR